MSNDKLLAIFNLKRCLGNDRRTYALAVPTGSPKSASAVLIAFESGPTPPQGSLYVVNVADQMNRNVLFSGKQRGLGKAFPK